MPEQSIPKEAAYQIINDELMLDGNPRLNLASFVTTWMEPECDKLIMAAINKNYVDMDEYPVTTELQVRTSPDDFDPLMSAVNFSCFISLNSTGGLCPRHVGGTPTVLMSMNPMTRKSLFPNLAT